MHQRSTIKRTWLALASTLLCLACSQPANEAMGDADATVDPDLTETSCAVSVCATIGKFSIEWGGEADSTLSIRHVDQAQESLWHSTDEVPLLTSSASDVTITDSRGSFTFDVEHRETCQESVIQGVDQTHDAVVLNGAFADCESTFIITFTAASDHRLRFEAAVHSPEHETQHNVTTLGWASVPSEGFFGFGAQYNYLDLKGRLLPIWCQEQGHGRGLEPITDLLNEVSPGSGGAWYTSYTCVPYFLSTRGYGLVLENLEYI
ncbi:MAG: hypothetical protein QF464_14970, partial [Myxococcota bacterium]|nr:hypothetical protein [Myxococcota bacterium]